MDELIGRINRDAMIMEDVNDLVYQAALTNGRLVEEAWKRISLKLQDIITRLGLLDKEMAYEMLGLWEKTGEEGKDSRRLAAAAENNLMPIIPRVMDKLYGSFVVKGNRWSLTRSKAGYFTIFETESGRYVHSPYDPMHEAGILALRIYKEDLEEIHILGSGLGYLPYQIWKCSHKSLKIFIYEEDEEVLTYAENAGVLGWIDEDDLIIVENKDSDKMLALFLENAKRGKYCYVSDWKQGEYNNSTYGKAVDRLDFDHRTEIDLGGICRINRRKNERIQNDNINFFKTIWNPKSSEFAVVSSGPSLNYNIQFLRDNQDKINIVAVNSCLKRLFKEGIRPDIIAMLDPLTDLRKHLEGIEKDTEGIPLISVNSGSWTFISVYKGPVYYIDDTGIKEKYEWSFSGTVSSMALDIAYYLGADRIYLIGSDLAMPDGRNYADGLVHGVKENTYEDVEHGIWVESADGKMVQTNALYNAYREMMEDQISAHRTVKVYNMSREGAKIKGTIEYTGKDESI